MTRSFNQITLATSVKNTVKAIAIALPLALASCSQATLDDDAQMMSRSSEPAIQSESTGSCGPQFTAENVKINFVIEGADEAALRPADATPRYTVVTYKGGASYNRFFAYEGTATSRMLKGHVRVAVLMEYAAKQGSAFDHNLLDNASEITFSARQPKGMDAAHQMAFHGYADLNISDSTSEITVTLKPIIAEVEIAAPAVDYTVSKMQVSYSGHIATSVNAYEGAVSEYADATTSTASTTAFFATEATHDLDATIQLFDTEGLLRDTATIQDIDLTPGQITVVKL